MMLSLHLVQFIFHYAYINVHGHAPCCNSLVFLGGDLVSFILTFPPSVFVCAIGFVWQGLLHSRELGFAGSEVTISRGGDVRCVG